MAKPIDRSKIERIREAAISIIGRQGTKGCSVAAIAAEAGVSVGYLYRHYSGKEQLIGDMLEFHFDLINNKILSLIAENRGIKYVVEGVVRHILDVAGAEPLKVRFLITLLNDFSGETSDRMKLRLQGLAATMINLLKQSSDADSDLTEEDLYFAMIGLPMQYLSQQYGPIVSAIGNSGGKEHIVAMALKIISKVKND